jgi:hypothetical protein
MNKSSDSSTSIWVVKLLHRVIEKAHNPFQAHVLFIKEMNYIEIRK